jgi:hypothetical protein
METDIVTKKIIEPKDWIKKYFKPNNLGAAFEFINLTIGINNKRLISIILQIKKFGKRALYLIANLVNWEFEQVLSTIKARKI